MDDEWGWYLAIEGFECPTLMAPPGRPIKEVTYLKVCLGEGGERQQLLSPESRRWGSEGNRGSHFVLSQNGVMPHGLYRFLTVNPCVTSLKLTLLLQILQILNYTRYTYPFLCTEILHDSFTNFKVHT